MIEKLKTGVWFAQRPKFWPHAGELVMRKVLKSRDTDAEVRAATAWASQRAGSVSEALTKAGLLTAGETVPRLPESLLDAAKSHVRQSKLELGGAGDIELLYAAALLSGSRRIIETGVAYGWSSLALLAGIEGRAGAQLVSVDMPYPKLNNEAIVGVAVPELLRGAWQLVREPDRHGLSKAIGKVGGTIDLCHYDSDKSYRGRQFGYGLMWDALCSGGIFISDDIQDNLAFKEFVEREGAVFAVTAYEKKFVGIARKP
jgi:predicted O-methyltransferase YrrM